MEPIRANFMLIKVAEDKWDVIITGEQAVLNAFSQTYSNLFYLEKSVFDKKPVVIAPDFPNQDHAKIWIEYWEMAFEEPENACKSCPTVQELFGKIEANRKNLQASD
jgi:hypothetical protein